MSDHDITVIPQAIGDLFQSSGIGTLGVDVFLYGLPQDKNGNAIVIIPTGGPKLTGNPTSFKQFQISVRNTHIQSALPKVQEIRNLLEETPNVLSGINGRFELDSEPGAYSNDGSGHSITVLNFTFVTASQK